MLTAVMQMFTELRGKTLDEDFVLDSTSYATID